MCVCVCLCLCVCVCAYMCIYICIYIYIHTHKHFFFCEKWGHPIGVMVFILYKLYLQRDLYSNLIILLFQVSRF